MTSMKRKVIEAWLGFVDGRPHLYQMREDGNPVFDFYTTKRKAKKCYADVRKVRIEWMEESTPERR